MPVDPRARSRLIAGPRRPGRQPRAEAEQRDADPLPRLGAEAGRAGDRERRRGGVQRQRSLVVVQVVVVWIETGVGKADSSALRGSGQGLGCLGRGGGGQTGDSSDIALGFDSWLFLGQNFIPWSCPQL